MSLCCPHLYYFWICRFSGSNYFWISKEIVHLSWLKYGYWSKSQSQMDLHLDCQPGGCLQTGNGVMKYLIISCNLGIPIDFRVSFPLLKMLWSCQRQSFHVIGFALYINLTKTTGTWKAGGKRLWKLPPPFTSLQRAFLDSKRNFLRSLLKVPLESAGQV